MMGKFTAWAKSRKEMIDTLATSATDAAASRVPALYPTLAYTGALIKAGTRIRWGDRLYSAQYDTWDRQDTDPEHDANGWAPLNFHSGYRDIPDTMTTSNMFKKDEIGWRTNKFWKSLIDNNSWTPEGYPAGWTEVTV